MRKPKTCLNCPAVRLDKNKIYCACKRELEADKTSEEEKHKMLANCVLDWE